MVDILEELGRLAFEFRGTRDEIKRQKIAVEYRKLYCQLQNEFPPPEDQLPNKYMSP